MYFHVPSSFIPLSPFRFRKIDEWLLMICVTCDLGYIISALQMEVEYVGSFIKQVIPRELVLRREYLQ
jgi:hypothetical protein